jgi:hypothetical protein
VLRKTSSANKDVGDWIVPRKVSDEVEYDRGLNGKCDVHGTAGHSYPDHAAARISERSKIDRHRLGIPEKQ